MTDLASLVLEVDSSQVPKATAELDKLTAAGARTEVATSGLGKTTKTASQAAAEMAAQAQASSRGITSTATAAGAAQSKVANLTGQVTRLTTELTTGQRSAQTFAAEIGRIALLGSGFGPLTAALVAVGAAAAVAFGAMKLFQAEVAKSGELQAYAAGLGLTTQEMKKLKDVSVTIPDIFKGIWKTISDHTGADRALAAFKDFAINQFKLLLRAGVDIFAGIYGAIVGTYNAAIIVWRNFPGAIADAFYMAVNSAIGALNKLIQNSVSGINGFISKVNGIFGTSFATISAPQIAAVKNVYAGAARELIASVSSEYQAATEKARAAANGIIREVEANIVQASKDRIKAQADEIIGDRNATKASQERTKALKDQADAETALLDKIRQRAKNDWASPQDVGVSGDSPNKLDSSGSLDAFTKLPDYGQQFLDQLRAISDQAQITAGVLSNSFGPLGDVFGGLLANVARYGELQAKVSQEVAAGAMTQAQADKELGNARDKAIAQGLSGLKGLFSEHSKGYKVMQAVERAYALFKTATTIASIAQDAMHTGKSVANSATRAAADEAAGASKIFSQLGVWAFPVVAAMVALLATFALGGGGGGGGGAAIPNVEDLQAKQGAGTVLGDASAKSESIARSLDIMSKNSVQGLNYTADMVRSLRSIDSGISKLAGNIARDIQVGNLFDSSALKLGTFSSGGLFGKSQLRELGDQGLVISTGGPLNLASHYKNQALWDQAMKGMQAGTVADILKNGLYGASYTRTNETNTKKGVMGIGGGSSSGVDYDTGSLSASILQSFTAVIGSIRDSILKAADLVGLQGAQALIDAFKVNIGQISFEGMTGKEIEDQLNAVFSSIGDQMTEAAFPALKELQKVGEGLFETFMRVAKDYSTIDAALSSIGMSFGSVGVASLAARERLIDLAGGLDKFVEQTDYFFNNFFSDADKIAFAQTQVNGAFTQLGIAAPATLAQFKALVSGLNLSTDAGQDMFEALMTIAPAFYKVQQASQQYAEKTAKMQIQLLQAQGDATGALALQREIELAGIDESLRGLQQQIYLAQDVAKARDNLTAAYKRESGALQQTVDKFTGFATSLKKFRDSLFGGGSSGLNYNQALAKLIGTGSLAAAGDQDALGGLQDAAQKFLDIAQQNAGSLADVERARALVARYLDQAIGGAEGQASIAQQQLDQMKSQVSALVDIDDHVQTVAEAIQALNALLTSGGPSASVQAFAAPASSANDKTQATLESIQAAVEQSTVSNNKVARLLSGADRGGALAVYTDADSPLATTGGGVGDTLS